MTAAVAKCMCCGWSMCDWHNRKHWTEAVADEIGPSSQALDAPTECELCADEEWLKARLEREAGR